MDNLNLEEQLIKTATTTPSTPQGVDKLETSPDADAKKNKKNKNVYTNLIDNFNEHYKARNKHNRGMKIAFFVLAFVSLMIALIMCFYMVYKMLDSDTFTWEYLAGIIGALGTFLTSLLVLPKMIGDYLFPNNGKDEDQALLQFIQYMRNAESTEYQAIMLMDREVEIKQKVEKEAVLTSTQAVLLSNEAKEKIEKKKAKEKIEKKTD